MEAQMTKADPTMSSRPQLLFHFSNGYVASLIVRDLGDAMLAYWPFGHKEMIKHLGSELTDNEVANQLTWIADREPHLAGKMSEAAQPVRNRPRDVRAFQRAVQSVTSRPKPKRRTHKLRVAYDPANP